MLQIAAPVEAEPPAESDFNLFSLLDADFRVGPWKFRGYVQIDGAAYDQAPPGPLETDFRRGGLGDGDPGHARELTDGALLRRARLGGEGTYGKDIAYRAMFELTGVSEGAQPRVAEVWVTWRRFAPYSVTVGAFPQLANMADATSSDSMLFLERPTAAQLSRELGGGDGRIGIMARRATPRSMVAVSLTGPVIDHAEDYTPRSAIVARATRTMRLTDDTRVQLGGSATYVLQTADRQADVRGEGFPVRFRATPEVVVDDTPLIDTGDLPARHANVLGVEFAAQRRNLFVQAEAFRFAVDRDDGAGDDPRFWGFYVLGSWVLTGERRRFDPSRGVFWMPTPAKGLGEGGWGAWELAFRYSRMNLNFHPGAAGQAPPPDGVRGGDQQVLQVGLDWYPRPRFRLMLSYMNVRVDRLNPARPGDPQPFGPPPATPPVGAQIGQHMNVLALRARYSF